MLVIKIDAVDPETPKRCFAGAGDRFRLYSGNIFTVDDLPVEEPDLGRNDDPVALVWIALQPAADDLFAFAAAMARHPVRVDVGGVDHVAAGFDEFIEDAEAGRFIGGPAEHVP